MDEIILIDKPENITSFGVVARVRRVLSSKQERKTRLKVGHTGTLDPFATGLLIILVGKATKRSNEFLKLDKEYIAEIRLGEVSTTGDPEGEIMRTFDMETGRAVKRTETGEEELGEKMEIPSWERVEEVVKGFIGEILQKVPAYSAVKINGERAYKLARKGKEVKTPERKVRIYKIEILEYEFPKLVIRTEVSSGTYIRTLGEDIGKALGVGAYLTALRRTKIDKYDVKDAIKLQELMESC